MKSYGQFCPVAKAAEIISERWTLLILRELLMGSVRFSDLRRGLGTISPSVLTQRLHALEDHGIVVRKGSRRPSDRPEYHLTEAGRAMLPIIEAAGVWGYRWLRETLGKEDLDVDLLMLDMSRRIRTDRMRYPDAVIEVHFTDVEPAYRYWWLVVQNRVVDLCYDNPGRTPDIKLASTLSTMTQLWMGRTTIADARRRRILEVSGARDMISSMPEWFVGSYVAEIASVDRR